MTWNNKCDGCGSELTNSYSYSGGCLFSSNHNFFQAFLGQKGKNKEDNDKFQFCDECEKEFKNYLIEESVKELKQKNIANSEMLTYRFFRSDFTKESWQKYQTALAENIKLHSGEWQIKEFQHQPYEREKPRKDGRSRLFPKEIERKIILFHQSAKLEYELDGSLTLENSYDPRKMYFTSDFLPEKWIEIKNALKNPQQEDKDGDGKGNNTIKQAPINNDPPTTSRAILIIFGVIIPIIGMIFFLTYLTIKRKVRIKIK